MGRDRGYGSGKPRSAANSASRRDRAASAGLRKQAQQRQAAKPFAKAKAKAVADGSYGKIQELGISSGLKALYTLGRMAPKYMGKSIVEVAAAANRVRAYNEGVYARETYSRAAKLSKMKGPKVKESTEQILKWADARKLKAQDLRNQSRSLLDRGR
jgi:hypothetical protein